jgi:hypothetical protein
MISLELVGALLLGATVLWFVLGPLARSSPRSVPEAFDEPTPLEETRRGQALVALNEIEFDHATGKLSDEDFSDLRRRHGRQALALLATAEANMAEANTAEAMVSRARGASGAPRCPDCGPRPEPDAVFCSSCGRQIV